MKIAIYALEKTLFEGEGRQLSCFSDGGQMTILDEHIPLISILTGPAVEIVRVDGERVRFVLTAGVVEVRPHSEVVILADAIS